MAEKKKKKLETPEDLDKFMTDEPEAAEDIFEEEEEEFKEPQTAKEEDIPLPEMADEDEKEEDLLDIAADVPVQVVAVMGKRNITLKEIASLRMGEVIDLNRPANEIVDLVVGGKLVAKGELVEIEGKLGVRIVKMVR